MQALTIATWNVNSLKVRLTQVLNWIETFKPDILALQEIKLEDAFFPLDVFTQMGYHAIYNGQKTYNGVAILSLSKPENVLKDIEDFTDPQRRIIAATYQGIRVINLYIPNGESLKSPKFPYKLDWLDQVSRFLHQQLQQYTHVVVLGDFNIAPENQDVHNPTLWEGRVLFSEAERSIFKKWLAIGLHDSFRLFTQPEKSFTWWDYRALAFRRNHGLRIDHILVSTALKEFCTRCVIDKEARKVERPSDHAPVIAYFNYRQTN
jgi:exodeoxyribonuclease-3